MSEGGRPVTTEINQAQGLTSRYVAIWNEPDPAKRRPAIAELWSEDAVHILQPPKEVREAAASLAVTPIIQARGHAELEARVTRAHQQFVDAGGNSFRPRDDGGRLGKVVKLRQETVNSAEDALATGLDFVILDIDGRIQTDDQFMES